jgi:NRAMP (natural resistance-associated macrophage protein)-like metal ion transporter
LDRDKAKQAPAPEQAGGDPRARSRLGAFGRRVRTATWFRQLGPGLITGAADDDPSGIATYSQVGAQFGLDMLWTTIFTFPLMTAVQSVSARIGRVTGKGLAANMSVVFPRWFVTSMVGLLFAANTINAAADLSAMGEATSLVLGGWPQAYTVALALVSLGLQLLVPYHRYVRFLKWLTLALFAYVGVVLSVRIDWLEVAARTAWPHLHVDGAAATAVVAVFGTTISPYLFFWQSAEEVEDVEADPVAEPLARAPAQAPEALRRIRWDTLVGMAFSNVIAFTIILSAAATLHAAGGADIQTAAQAAQALRPAVGDAAFLLFAVGILGAGLLAVPVLAGSAAYAIGEARGWVCGLEHKPWEAVGFYSVIGASVVLALLIGALGLQPFRLLFWSAVLTGVISAPIMAAMMLIACRRGSLGPFVASPLQRALGWAATGAMALASGAMLLLNLVQ